MPRQLKKPRAVYPIEDQIFEDSEPENDEMIDSEIAVEFEAFTAEDSDFHGIKILLNQSLKSLQADISGLANTIISQNCVGSVVRQVYDEEEDEEDDDTTEDEKSHVYGVTTILNLTSRKDESAIASLRTSLVEKCQSFASDTVNTLFRECLGNESKHVGLLISERLINLPVQLSIPLYDSLLKEIREATRNQMPFNFSYIIMVCKILKGEDGDLIWSNPEEEFCSQESIGSFEYKISDDGALAGDWGDNDDNEYSQWRQILLLKASDLPSLVDKIKHTVQ